MSDKPEPGKLQDRNWKRFLRGPDPMLLEELYVPALAAADRYDRSCAYFSSSVLAAAARGFAKLIQHLITMGDNAPKPAVRLLVNEQLEPDDVQALTETGDTSVLEEALLKRFKTPKDVLEKDRLAMLGWMVKSGMLEVRVGVMRHGSGIMHAKFGIMYDGAGDAVVFNGSGNESAHGLAANYEQLEVSGSWQDGERFDYYKSEFESLWANQHDHVYTVSLPEALKQKLIKFATKEPPAAEPTNAMARQKAAMIWRFIAEACYLPNGATACDATAMIDLWPHHKHVVEDTAGAWPAGRLLCDEVGMGKTVQAIVTLRRLLAGRGVRRALLLVPAGLMKQWQEELREKGGLVVPRLEGLNTLVWPNESEKKVESLAEALKQDILLMSRETARTENNVPILLAADPWDVVLLDEAHAARRAKQVETEFNSGNFLLDMLRKLQLRQRAKGIILLSATPMQTHPWEPWDLLSVLGEGDRWMADFSTVREFYNAIAKIKVGQCDLDTATAVAETVLADPEFPPFKGAKLPSTPGELGKSLAFAKVAQRPALTAWLRSGSPLARRMHRNTRATLRKYHEMGLLSRPPAFRKVNDVQFDYLDKAERAVYDAVTRYIDRRFKELEGEKPGKGFVMTIYRRRASSSPQSLLRSLERRRSGLMQVANQRAHDTVLMGTDVPEAISFDDVPDGETRISLSLPQNPEVARKELTDVEQLIAQLNGLSSHDSKRDRFFDYLKQLTDDGRPALVFTEYVDTLEYLRDNLVDYYQGKLACYSGSGGQIFDGADWKHVGKEAITGLLRKGQLQILLCTDAASEGLNLQTASALINYDLPWNPSKVEQRIGRIDRIGQKWAEVLIVNLFLKNSIDERVYGVLRSRCHLFEHFVGAMQPVLSRAKKMLQAEESPDLKALEEEANLVQQDSILNETYVDADAEASDAVPAAVRREDIIEALKLLDGAFGPIAKAVGDDETFLLSGAGAKKLIIAASAEALDSDHAALPLCPLQPFVRELLGVMQRPGERLPLVISSALQGGFRASIAYWIGVDGKTCPLTTMTELRERVENWDGDYAPPANWQHAETKAAGEAKQLVAALIQRCQTEITAGLSRQTSAARRRLLKDLGRYLVCADGETDDLNRVFHHLMTRDIAGARRLMRCFELFGKAYPEWDDSLRGELAAWSLSLSAGQRRARFAGAELEAAIRDPRWEASGADATKE